MIIKAMPVGPIMANCYIVGCEQTKKAAVIDPGDEAEMILDTLKGLDLTAECIINTHGHFDHVGANLEMKEATGAPLVIHKDDAPMLDHVKQAAAAFGLAVDNSPEPDRMVADGDEIEVGNLCFRVIHTPGHSPGGMSLLCEKALFVGDTLFQGSIGRTDFPGGDFDTLISSIQKKLFVLPDDVKVYTGHGPATSIGQEKRTNPFCRMA